MNKHGGIDNFRLVLALLVVGAHTFPLLFINEELNHIVFRVLARIAVPFFLMVTGYFLVPKFMFNEGSKPKLPTGFIKKTGLIFAISTLLYLPVNIYSNHFSSGNIVAIMLKDIVFDGTFYHLWYLPASIIGVLVLFLLGHRFSIRATLGISAILYLFGLLGDSYYGLIQRIPALDALYAAGFHLYSYTRNGIFLAPVFLSMGAWIAKSENHINKKTCIIGFIASVALLLAEGTVLHNYGSSRHDSMYVSLLPCMYFLFQYLLRLEVRTHPKVRDVSMYIYILHPMLIIAVRGVAKITGLSRVLIDNNMIHFLLVCILTGMCSIVIARQQYKTPLDYLRIRN